MPLARWADLLAEWIFHTLIAALVAEALVRLWRVESPRQRISLRALAFGYPLLVFPVLALLVPARRQEWFRDRWALFDGRRWNEVTVFGVGLYPLWIAAFAGLGLALLLLDLWPLLRARSAPPALAAPDPERARVEEALGQAAAAMNLPAPALVFTRSPRPLLFCSGVRRPALVISRGAAARLDGEELRAALRHELAHLAARDPAVSWLVLAARAAMAFNPAFQVLARALARDAEWRADDRSASASRDRLALASALLELHRATAAPAAGPFGALSEPLARARALDVERRCRRLLEPAPERVPFGATRVLLAGVAISGLLFFVI